MQKSNEVSALINRLAGMAAENVMRVEAALPSDCRTCRDLWEQWRDGFQMGLKHADNKQARQYADEAFRMLGDELQRHGITTV